MNNITLWNTLKNEIRTIPTDYPVFIYVCVGGASHSDPDTELLPQDYQQFPPFLQAMHNTYPKLHLVILLIDPLQECPPRVVRDYSLQEMPDANQMYYKNQDGTIRTFVLKQAVYTDVEKELFYINNAINITKELKELNEFARCNDVTLLYDTFTGRPISILAENYDMDNKKHLQQIVYGISGRDNHGCQTDLTHLLAYYPYRLEKNRHTIRPIIHLYNHYKYIVNNDYTTMEYDLKQYPIEMHTWACLQKNKIIENNIDKFKNVHLSVLRDLYCAIHNNNHDDDNHDDDNNNNNNNNNNHIPNFKNLPLIYQGLFDDLYNQDDYSLLNELFSNYLASELEIIINLKNIELSGEQMLQMITNDDDPYKWYDNLVNIMKLVNST
jgi:hypothetical protein